MSVDLQEIPDISVIGNDGVVHVANSRIVLILLLMWDEKFNLFLTLLNVVVFILSKSTVNLLIGAAFLSLAIAHSWYRLRNNLFRPIW